MKPEIEIICWNCKRYDAYYCRCRQTKREITWVEAHNCYCYNWASGKRSVSYALCVFNEIAPKGTIQENGCFCRLKGESEAGK